MGETMLGRAPNAEPEYVVLVDRRGNATGQQLKSAVHGTDTPLHLAFSLYLFDSEGRLLMTRRALGKSAWPGVWTNSCCGHPMPGELMDHAIERRAQLELGVPISRIRSVLPAFSYRARDSDGVVENEICPVFTAVLPAGTILRPDPAEVQEWAWAGWDDVVAAVAAAPFAFSPWAVEQIQQLGDVAAIPVELTV